MNNEAPLRRSPNAPIHQLVQALESRHLASLTRSEVGRALRALSSWYVERRAKLASGAPLETAGKRAAFALYYGPLHFVIVSEIVRANGVAQRGIRTIHDLGCGTGVGGAAWAIESERRPIVAGLDRSAWAVDEANWLYRELTIRGRAVRGDLSRPLRAARRSTLNAEALLLAYASNELPTVIRTALLRDVLAAVEARAVLLVVEPIGTRLGNASWWEEWRRALEPHGVVEQEWRFPATLLPESTKRLGRAAGLDPRELTARTLASR